MDLLKRRRLMMAGSTEHSYSADYLTIEIITGGTLNFNAQRSNTTTKTVSYRVNSGSWTTWTSAYGGSSKTFQSGDIIELKGNNSQYATSAIHYNSFLGTATFNVYGNIMSLISGDSFVSSTVLSSNYAFANLFSTSNMISARNLLLPATTLTQNCYRLMFSDCSLLTEGPEILPATTLEVNCYYGMFRNSTNITIAPILPATTLTNYCYYNMFTNCSNLNYIKCLALTTANNSTTNWVNGVAATGTFVKNINKNDWGRDQHGIPVNWTVENATS